MGRRKVAGTIPEEVQVEINAVLDDLEKLDGGCVYRAKERLYRLTGRSPKVRAPCP